MQVYLMHGLLLNILKLEYQVDFENVVGYMLTMGNFVLTTLLCYLISRLLSCNSMMKWILSIK